MQTGCGQKSKSVELKKIWYKVYKVHHFRYTVLIRNETHSNRHWYNLDFIHSIGSSLGGQVNGWWWIFGLYIKDFRIGIGTCDMDPIFSLSYPGMT